MMHRRFLGGLLVTTGLVLMAWPVVTWAYGLYWQERMIRAFPRAVTDTVTAQTVPAAPHRGASLSSPKSPTPKSPKPRKQAKRAARKPLPARIKRSPRTGEAFARLRIERIGLDAIVVEGVTDVALRRGPGHLPRTGLPGERGNCAIAAHRDGWFRRLPEVRAGDPISVETPDGVYRYLVEEKKVVTP
jgi:hypothetical protein